jgi:hypothetical protein
MPVTPWMILAIPLNMNVNDNNRTRARKPRSEYTNTNAANMMVSTPTTAKKALSHFGKALPNSPITSLATPLSSRAKGYDA